MTINNFPQFYKDWIKIVKKNKNKILSKKILGIVSRNGKIRSIFLDTKVKTKKKEIFERSILIDKPGVIIIPILYFKKGFGLERDLEQSNYLKNIHYNYAVREVLQTYIVKSEIFADCKVREVWIEKFKNLTKEDLPEKMDEEGKDWLDKAVAAFLDEKQQGLNGRSLIDLMPDSSMLLTEKLTFKANR